MPLEEKLEKTAKSCGIQCKIDGKSATIDVVIDSKKYDLNKLAPALADYIRGKRGYNGLSTSFQFIPWLINDNDGAKYKILTNDENKFVAEGVSKYTKWYDGLFTPLYEKKYTIIIDKKTGSVQVSIKGEKDGCEQSVMKAALGAMYALSSYRSCFASGGKPKEEKNKAEAKPESKPKDAKADKPKEQNLEATVDGGKPKESKGADGYKAWVEQGAKSGYIEPFVRDLEEIYKQAGGKPAGA